MKYYIIAGEASGDLHGSNLIRGIKKADPEAEILAWGGEKMQEAGAEIRKHYKQLAIMGFVEVIAHLNTIRKNFRFAKNDIIRFNPDVLITIDFPGFNLRLARWAKKAGFKTFHYISPNVWAWKKDRVYSMRKNLDKIFAILPFEPEFYRKFDVDVEYQGHPLIDAVNHYQPLPLQEFQSKYKLSDKPVIAILPGSRKQEISRMLPLMLETAENFPGYEYLIAGAPGMEPEFYQQFLREYHQAHLLFDATYDILYHAKAGMITSGTATLEAALFDVPQVVCYKTSPLSFNIARMFVKIRRFSLVNLIMDEDVVTELIQHQMTRDSLKNEFQKILPGGEKRKLVLEKYEELKTKLGEHGVSDRIASAMYSLIS
ncbi:MAG: lipid-A-disaccharide synthase [Bacteroidales bacterium]